MLGCSDQKDRSSDSGGASIQNKGANSEESISALESEFCEMFNVVSVRFGTQVKAGNVYVQNDATSYDIRFSLLDVNIVGRCLECREGECLTVEGRRMSKYWLPSSPDKFLIDKYVNALKARK